MTTIRYRYDPCNCGCQGRDPWHAPTFDRVLRDVIEERGEALLSSQSFWADPAKYRRRAAVKMPWSKQPVPVVEIYCTNPFANGREIGLGWHFIRD